MTVAPKTFMLLTATQAAAVREVAVSESGQTEPPLIEAGLKGIVASPYRVRLRIGEAPPSRPHMDPAATAAARSRGPVTYRRREPLCRECGRRVAAGVVIVFGLKPGRYGAGRPAFLHFPSCPDG